MTGHFLSVNGSRVTVPSDGRRLLDWLRDDLGLKGAKDGCSAGECGTCTVLADGRPILSCCVPAALSATTSITTIEGLAQEPSDPLLGSFVRHGAMQCGFCTPGMILAARGAINRRRITDEASARCALSGNVCRCTGYGSIVDAVLEIALKGQHQPPIAGKSDRGGTP